MKLIRNQAVLVSSAMALTLASTIQAQESQPAASATPAPEAAKESRSFVNLQGTDLHIGNLPPVTFHGFASQGFLYTTDYNYLDRNTKDGSFKFFEAGLNASINPFPHTRIAAQGFAYDIGEAGEYDPVLDYALAEYTFNDYLGIRGGRIRRPQGIYNAIQDVDLARTFVLLPQGMYDARWRDFFCSVDGGEFFGTIPLSKAGSLSYETYAGMMRPKMNGGLAQSLQNSVPLDNIPSVPAFGGQFWYNTPVDGLRAGYSINYASDVEYDYTLPFVGAGMAEGNTFIHQGSLEYLWKSWTFQAEYRLQDSTIHNTTRFGRTPDMLNSQDSWYASAAYRFNKWVEAGAYYTEAYTDTHMRNNSLRYQKDTALALRFDPTSWWIFKIEGHYLTGTGLLQDNKHNPISSQNDNGWFMLAMKTTFSF